MSFSQDMLNIVNDYKKDPRLENNALIKRLFIDTDFVNLTQQKFNILRTDDISLMPVTERTSIQVALNDLISDENLSVEDKEEFKELYNALFHYSLIIHKGGRGKNSISSLFDPGYYVNESYLKSLSDIKADDFKDNDLALFVLSTVKAISTKEKANIEIESTRKKR